MADSIKIKLDTAKYVAPTEEDIRAAKQYILQREAMAEVLQDRIDELLDEAAEKIVTICYKYNVDPKLLYFSSAFNREMMDEIAEVMDELESAILDLIYEYSTRATNDRDRMNWLAAWIALLGRGNRNLQDTLDGYLYKTMKDWEAAIAAMRYAGLPLSVAVTRLKTFKHSIYTMPEVIYAFKHSNDFTATYIGVQKGAVGISNNGSNNVVNMAKTTLQMAWMKSLSKDYEENGVVMYCVQRGSTYLCPLCDSHVGVWSLDDLSHFPPFHPHCCCVVFPIYKKEEIPQM